MKNIVKYSLILLLIASIAFGIFYFGKKYLQNREKNSVTIEALSQEESKDADEAVSQELENQAIQNEVQSEAPSTDQKEIPNPTSAKSTATEISKTPVQKTQSENNFKIVSNLVSWGFQKSGPRKIDTIVIHTTYNALGGDVFDKNKCIQEWKDAGVAPHYMIARNGEVLQLVADQNIAWHAGDSKTPDGRTNVNSFSIGIEIVNDKESKFSDEEYRSLNKLLALLKSKYQIKYILGHDEIAPGRKTDPWGIEWSKVSR